MKREAGRLLALDTYSTELASLDLRRRRAEATAKALKVADVPLASIALTLLPHVGEYGRLQRRTDLRDGSTGRK